MSGSNPPPAAAGLNVWVNGDSELAEHRLERPQGEAMGMNLAHEARGAKRIAFPAA